MFIINNAIKYALPIAAALLLVIFFSGLPALHLCLLPQDAPLSAGGRVGKKGRRLSPADGGLVLLITLLYAAAAFRGLGDGSAPESFAEMGGLSAVIRLESDDAPSRLMLYSGVGVGRVEIAYSADGSHYEEAFSFQQTYTDVLKWHALTPTLELRPRYVRVTCLTGDPWLGELVLLDGDGQPIPVSCSIPQLCDEPETVALKETYHNSSYFDEIYHVRTAWEHLHRIWPYEISHPPLGKSIISLGITLLGMTPFGWRFMGTLFGVLMVPVFYLLLKKLFGGLAVPALGTLVFAADFMHFVQTRIATVDSFAVFFILCAYLCLYVYLRRENRAALALCGVSFGLGCACKWICVYAGLGLGLLWAGHWLLRALDATRDESRSLLRAFIRNVLFCLVFFVLVPALIYYLSYLPYGRARGVPLFGSAYTKMVLDNQSFMFSYHSSVTADHPYASRWYQWVLDIRPILYYREQQADGRIIRICALLSPALCWGGLLSLFVLFYTALFRRDRKAAFILVGYFSQLLPWVFIKRPTFEYHYFASSLFLALAIGYVFALMRDNVRSWLRFTVPFAAASVLLFVLFYPSLAGYPVSVSWADTMMRWLPTWPL